MPSVRELVTTWGFQVDTKPLTQLDKTLHGLKTAVNTLITGFALKEFWKLIESTAEAGHEAELTAQKVGVNADKLQAMQYAAKLVNVSQEEMSTCSPIKDRTRSSLSDAGNIQSAVLSIERAR